MNHFVNQLQYYLLFEVLECAWDKLNKFLQSGKGDLDQLLSEHDAYLRDICIFGLIGPVGTDKTPLYSMVIRILQNVLNFSQVYVRSSIQVCERIVCL